MNKDKVKNEVVRQQSESIERSKKSVDVKKKRKYLKYSGDMIYMI